MEKMLQQIKEYLPAPGTELGCYTFLPPDALWTGTVESQCPFVVVAEDDWGDGSGLLIIVMADGSVHIAELGSDDVAGSDYRNALDLGQECLIDYCAADFPRFMEIMKLYLAALETISSPKFALDDGDYEEKCAELEKTLRQQVAKIDPSAIEDTESLWSTLIEELGAGM